MAEALEHFLASKIIETDEDFLSTIPAVLPHALPEPTSLLPTDELESLLNDPERISINLNQRYVDHEVFQTRVDVDEQIAMGATVTVTALQREVCAVNDLCDSLSRAAGGTAIFAASHLTPPGERAFAVHYDYGSTLAVQVSGEKTWFVGPPVVSSGYELKQEPKKEVAQIIPPKFATLEAGDALFVPRGWLHAAIASGEEESLHVNFGVIHDDTDPSRWPNLYP